MKDRYIMALDQGTTKREVYIYMISQGKQVSIRAKGIYGRSILQAGWVEHDPMDIWSTQIGVAQEALLKIDATYKNIDAIGITNQRENNSRLGPVYRRADLQCDSMAVPADRRSTVTI